MSDTTRSSDQAVTLTIDIGGTGTKMITVDHQGRPTSERLRELDLVRVFDNVEGMTGGVRLWQVE
jgi:predicted NBD/HSP70 family sugar kinase